MPDTGSVQTVINTQLTQGEIDQTIKGLREMDDLIRKMPQVMSVYKGSTGASDFKAASVELEGANKKMTEYSSLLTTVTQRMASMNGSSKEMTQLLLLEAKTRTEINKGLQVEEKTRLANEAATVKQSKATVEQSKADAIRIKSLIAQEKELERLIALEEKKNESQAKKSSSNYSAQNVPFTHNLNADGTIKENTDLAGSINGVSDAEKQLQAVTESGLPVQQTALQGKQEEILENSELAKARQALAKANSEDNVALQGYTAQKNLANKAAKEEALANLGLLTPYQQLNKQYESAANNAKNLSVEFGVNSVQAKAAAGEALALNMQIKEIDNTVGQSQKSVGNYSGAIEKAFGRATNLSAITGRAIQMLSRQIIGLGVGMLSFVIGAKAIEAVGRVLGEVWEKLTSKTLTNAEIKMQQLADATKSINEEFIKGSTASVQNLEYLRDVITDTTRKTTERKAAAEEYNKVADKGNELDLHQLGNLNLINDSISRQITLIEKRALATASEKIVADKGEAYLLAKETARVKAEEDYNLQVANGQILVNTRIKSNQYFQDLEKQGVINSRIASDEKVKQAKAEFDAAKDIAKQNTDKDGFVPSKRDKPTKAKKPKAEFDTTADEIKAEQDLIKIKEEMRKFDLEGQMKYLQQVIDDDNKSFLVRIKAAQEYAKLQQQLAQETEKSETDSINVKLSKIAEIELKDFSKRTNEEKKLLIDKQVLLAQKELAEKKYASAIESIHIDLAKKLKGLDKNFTESALKNIDEEFSKDKSKEILKNTQDETAAFDALNKKLSEGTITIEEYNKERQKISDDTSLKNDEADEKEIKNRIDLYKLYGKETTALEIDLLKLHTKIEKDKTKVTEDEAKKRADAEKQKAQAVKEIEKKSAELAITLGDGVYTKELNDLQDQIDASTKLKDAELERINSSSLSEQDKAAKIAQVNAAAAARQDQLDKKKKDTQLKQAKFDRDAQALSIFGNALAAHFKIIKDLGPILGTPVAIANDIAAAIDIALLFAKPLPKFFTGTKSSPEGFALTDEKGAEMYKTPSGEVFMGNDKPTIRYLERGTQIIPHDEVNRIMMRSMMESTSRMFGMGNTTDKKIDELKDVIMWQTNQLSKAYGKQKHKTVNNIHVDTKWGEYIQKQVFD